MLNLKSILKDLSTQQINQVVASGIRAGKHTSGNTNTNSGGNTSTNSSTGTSMSTGSYTSSSCG